MVDKVTKTVKVPASTAEDWEKYIEETPEVDSLSHLIRLSVERERQGKYTQAQQVAPDSPDDVLSGEVLTTLRGIQTGIEDLEERLTAIEETQSAEASYDLRKAIYEILPPDTELLSTIGIVDEIPKPENPDDLGVMTAREVAQKLGADTREVEEILDDLVESTGQIQRSDANFDGRYYWKRGKQ